MPSKIPSFFCIILVIAWSGISASCLLSSSWGCILVGTGTILQVSIFTFGPKKIKDRNVGKIVVRGKGWDASLGGWWFNLKLVDVLADRFNTKARR